MQDDRCRWLFPQHRDDVVVGLARVDDHRPSAARSRARAARRRHGRWTDPRRDDRSDSRARSRRSRARPGSRQARRQLVQQRRAPRAGVVRVAGRRHAESRRLGATQAMVASSAVESRSRQQARGRPRPRASARPPRRGPARTPDRRDGSACRSAPNQAGRGLGPGGGLLAGDLDTASIASRATCAR